MGGLVRVTAPAIEPIALSEAKVFLKQEDTTADDALIEQLITAARKRAEQLQGRAYVTQTWDYFLDAFPSDPWTGYAIEVPLPPLQSVTSIKYTDAAGVEATVSAADYYVDTASQPGRVIPQINKTWPSAVLRIANGVVVRFVAGFGDGTAVPESTKANLFRLLAHFYEYRNTEVGIPPELDALFYEDYAIKWA